MRSDERFRRRADARRTAWIDLGASWGPSTWDSSSCVVAEAASIIVSCRGRIAGLLRNLIIAAPGVSQLG